MRTKVFVRAPFCPEKIIVRIMLVVIVVASALWNTRQPAAAVLSLPKEQGGIVLENVVATYEFGGQITFLATIRSSVPIQTASIVILNEAGGITYNQPVALNPDGTTQFVLDARQTQLSPFTFIRWRYDLRMTDGTIFQSETFLIRYEDNRFAWQSLESNGLRVFWYAGDSSFAQTALNTALAGLREVNEIFPVDLNQPIEIFIYSTQNDLAFLGFEPWMAGHAEAALGVTLVAVEPGLDQSLKMEQRIPHEMLHVLLYRHIGAGYSNVPAWLREGLAALVEINPTSEYDRVLRDASIRAGLIPLLDLCDSFPAEPDRAFLAYAEARSFTTYLRKTFGSSALIDLAHRYADGVTCERGVEIVYGTSFAQLELRWRESMLGENALGVAVQNMLPYLILCAIVLGIPLFIGFNSMRRRGRDASRSARA